jgi:hypothetical protein
LVVAKDNNYLITELLFDVSTKAPMQGASVFAEKYNHGNQRLM